MREPGRITLPPVVSPRRCLRLLACGAFAVLIHAPPLRAQDADSLRSAGVAAAREGRLDEGRRLIEAALAATPGNRAALADLVVVLSWAGRDRQALARFDSLGADHAPAYAIAAAAVSARRSGQAARSARLYRAAIAGGESGTETRIGLALAEAALGDGSAARATLAEARAADPSNPRLREAGREVEALLRPDPAAPARRVRALAEGPGLTAAVGAARDAARGGDAGTAAALADALMDLRRPFDALAVLEPALVRAPRDASLRRREALALAAVGAPELALVRAAIAPTALGPPEERRIRGDANAFLVRWGAQVEVASPRDPAARYARTDAAIAALDAAIAAWTPLGPDAAGAVRAARLDRLAALRDRGRMSEVIAEAQSLREHGELPPYAREAVGDALLSQRRPEEAETEYRAVLAADPGALQPSLGLFYALSEQRRWHEAWEVARRLDRDIPAWRTLRGPEPPAAEWDRLQVDAAEILWRMWGDDLAGAEAAVAPLASAAPMNASLRSLRGDVWRLRGWPDQALEEYETALTNAPDDLDLRLGHAEALFDRRRYREARREIGALGVEYAESGAVRRLQRRLAVHDMRELEATVRGGLDRGSQDPELDVGMRLYSQPIAEAWRAFGGALLRTGDTTNGRLTTYRVVAGLEWRSPDVVLSGGVSGDWEGVNRAGAFIEATLRLSDRWVIQGGGEMTAVDTPLAALRAGIHADAARIGATWRQSDLREAAAYVRVMQFSDDNTRLIGFARWQERVMNLPDWKIDLQPYVYASSNSRQDVPYYSPERDLEAAATAALTWVAWKRYERDLRVRFIVTGGGYWQENFGWSPLFAARWENEQALSDTLSVVYGAGWVRRDYDGQSQDSGSVVGGLRWRF